MGIGLLKILSFYFRSNIIGLLTLGFLKFDLTVYNPIEYLNTHYYDVLLITLFHAFSIAGLKSIAIMHNLCIDLNILSLKYSFDQSFGPKPNCPVKNRTGGKPVFNTYFDYIYVILEKRYNEFQ
jgi:hypothetical protein